MSEKTYKIKPIKWHGDDNSYATYGGYYFEVGQIAGCKFKACVYIIFKTPSDDDDDFELIESEVFDKERDAHDWCEAFALQRILKDLEEL